MGRDKPKPSDAKKPKAKAESGAGGGSGEEKVKGCNHVKARHILCTKESKISEIYEALKTDGGDAPSAATFAKQAEQFSECSSGKRGGDLGWFPRGKMVGPFQDVAFATAKGQMSAPFRTTHGYHIVLVEDRKA